MNSKLRNILAIAALLGSLNMAYADSVQKLGYINPERIYTETATAKRIEATLQQEFSKQQQYLTNLQKEGLALRKKIANPQISVAKRQKLEAQWVEKGQKYRVAAAQLAEEYNLRRTEEFAALQNNANAIIKNIADSEHYDLILQEAVYVDRKFDLTDRVISLLDKQK